MPRAHFTHSRILPLLILGLLAVRGTAAQAPATVLPGVEVLVRHYGEKLAGKRLGILTNPTGVNRRLEHTIDLICALPKVEVVRLFAPEHGVRGGYLAGEVVAAGIDPVSRLPVVSLHGATQRPPAESLVGLDIVIYDIQDVGSRSYTYISTLTYMMEACEQAGVEVWVLDRPDPLGGDQVGGPVLEPALRSFIGIHDVPLVYGLTAGEFAHLIKAEWTPGLKLVVVPMQGWRRGMVYGDLGWPWVPPSQHIPDWESAFFYAMTGTYGELGRISEGVGTPQPFELVGAPWMDGLGLAAALNQVRIPGVHFRPATFRPRYGTFVNQECQGVQIHLLDAHSCNPADVSQAILFTLARLYPRHRLFAPAQDERYRMFLQALGDNELARLLAQGGATDAWRELNEKALEAYRVRRAKVLLYE